MLYLLATLALILKVNADSMEDSMEPCVQCCQIDPGHVTIHHDLAEGEEPPVLDFPHILFTDEMWDHTDALVEHLDSLLDDAEENILAAPEALEGAPEAAEYWIQKTAEMWALHGEGVQRIIHVDGTVGHIEPWPLPVGSKWIVGKLDLEEDMASEDMTSAEIDDQIIWSNVAAECIEKDGEYIWSTSVGDVYVALFERDNAECAYVNGEDVNGCDAPIAPPVAPATTTDPIEIDVPQPTDTSLPVDDLGDDNILNASTQWTTHAIAFPSLVCWGICNLPHRPHEERIACEGTWEDGGKVKDLP